MKRLAVCVLIVLLACSFVFAAGGSEQKAGVKEIVIGVFEPLTGENGGGGY